MLSPAATPLSRGPPMSGFSTARQKMVDGQVRPSDVTDIRIIDAMLAVPREAFVPADTARAGLSGPRSRRQRGGCGQALPDQARGDWRRCCRRPRSGRPTTSWWSAAPPDMPRPWSAKLAAKVTATESDPALAAKARDVLAEVGLGNVTVQAAAAADGDPADAPYDVIVLNGATEIVPERLYRQLREGGRLVGRICHDTAATGDHRDAFPWRFRQPAAVRCRCPGLAGPGAAPGLRFLACPASPTAPR